LIIYNPARMPGYIVFGTIIRFDRKDYQRSGPLKNKNFLASQMSINTEPFQRTDISTQPLGPASIKMFKANNY
jgi:hypothetical protein